MTVDIAAFCALLSRGADPGQRAARKKSAAAVSAWNTRRVPKTAPGVCSCGKRAPRGKTCGDVACRHSYTMEWQDKNRAKKRQAREAINGPTIYGPMPKGS